MNKTINFGRLRRFWKPVRDPLRLTALLYLREALVEERYEECAELVSWALKFGANPAEIQNLLEDVRRKPQA